MSSANLYQLTTEYQKLLPNLYDQETGEVNEEVEAQLNALSLTSEKKFIAVASWIKSMEAEKKEIEFIKKQIEEREAAYDKEINKATNYLDHHMKRCNIKEIKCPLFTIKIKINPPSTEIFDLSQLPEKFIRTRKIEKVEKTGDKAAIKEEVIRTGIQVPGAYVQKKTKLEIITDKI